MEFRDKCVKNDEKLRLIFKVEATTEEALEPAVIQENQPEADQSDDEEEEVITLNPNKLYESSGESDMEQTEEQPVIEQMQQQTVAAVKPTLKPVSQVSKERKETFHCRYCDVVFSDSITCSEHELSGHNQLHPFQCGVCSFNTDQHPTLIYHIKQVHNMDKPFLCTQCTKTFVRRSDLRKHTFVHAGIRLFSCDICKKSFTRNTNLTKHKRTHSQISKTLKCSLCPKAFYNNSELARHMEIHMDRKSFNCKYCNQAFVRRDQLEIHHKTHIENKPILQIEVQPKVAQPQPIVFYNHPADIIAAQSSAPMNFYTENSSYVVDRSAGGQMQEVQPKTEYPIMNQLLTGMNHVNQTLLPPIKNFFCGICNSGFSKKKDLDRHVMSIHTNIKQFTCDICSKSYNRRDKLMRHKKTHLAPPQVFSCAMCPAVFIRQHLLENHMKNHQMGNVENVETFLASLKPIVNANNGFTPTPIDPLQQMMIGEAQSKQQIVYPPESQVPEQLMNLIPMNLSVNDISSEPMNLSNDKLKIEPTMNAQLESDDESNGLKIVEEPVIKNPSLMSFFKTEPEVIQLAEDSLSERQFPMEIQETVTRFQEPEKQTENHEITFSMTSRIAELDKMEPLRDLPMEILNND